MSKPRKSGRHGGRSRVQRRRREALEHAQRLHQGGHLEAALDAYRRLADESPRDPDVLHYLGVCLHHSGESESGVEHIRRALAIAPDYPDAINNLGNCLLEQGHAEEAVEAYRRLIALRPDHANAHNNLGVALRGLGRFEESVAAYRKAIILAPEYAAAYQNLGNVFAKAGQLDDAVAAYLKALEIRPHDPAAYNALGKALYRAGRVDDAIAVFRQWLESDPNNPVARHMLAACAGEEQPERASDEYVRRMFDDFAASFDQVLARLEYGAPRLLDAAIDPFLPPDGAADILDAGCGTGLCAEFLAPRARRLVGVDLSKGMLGRARATRQYDELIQAELTAFLGKRRGEFDAIVSADTLVYFGGLAAVLGAAHGALRTSGILAFTVEEATSDGAPAGYALTPSGRYIHTREYVLAQLASAGFSAPRIAHDVLRQEAKQPVAGLVVVASA